MRNRRVKTTGALLLYVAKYNSEWAVSTTPKRAVTVEGAASCGGAQCHFGRSLPARSAPIAGARNDLVLVRIMQTCETMFFFANLSAQ